MAEEKETANDPIEKIRDYIASIRYGSVNIIIQDGRIVQIDKNEKIRF
jgi:hypothetical protein